MLRRRLRWIMPAAAIVLAGVLFLACYRPLTDRERISLTIQNLEASIEKKDLKGILSCISKDYRDQIGMTRRNLLQLAVRYVRSPQSARVVLSSVVIRVQHDTATISTHADVAYGERGVPANRISGDITFSLSKEGRQWRIISSSGWQDRIELY